MKLLLTCLGDRFGEFADLYEKAGWEVSGILRDPKRFAAVRAEVMAPKDRGDVGANSPNEPPLPFDMVDQLAPVQSLAA